MGADTNITLEQALDAYMDHFGTGYPLCIGKSNGMEEDVVTAILACIEDNTPAPEPVYDDRYDY